MKYISVKTSWIILVAFVLLTQTASSVHLLLIGDSFDRYWGHEWCEQKKSVFHNYKNHSNIKNFVYPNLIIWGHKSLDTGYHQTPLWCRDSITNDTVSQWMIFGSDPRGPYYKHFAGPTYETQYRLAMGFQNYFEQFDLIPDRIVIHSTAWDVSYWYQTMGRTFGKWHVDYSGIRRTIERQMYQLLDEVHAIVQKEVDRRKTWTNQTIDYNKFVIDIGVRTTSYRHANGEITNVINDIVRNMSAVRKCSMYDFDFDLWSSVDYHRHDYNDEVLMFRDGIHPMAVYSYPAIQKMLSRQYSQYYTNRARPVPTVLDSFQGYEGMDFQLMRAATEDNVKANNTPVSIYINSTDGDDHNLYYRITDTNVIPPVTDMNDVHTVHMIPGTGPLYYSMFVDGERVKYYLGDISLLYAKFSKEDGSTVGSQKAVARHSQHHIGAVRGDISRHHSDFSEFASQGFASSEKYYEHTMRVILENLVLSTSDMILLTPPLLNSVPTRGVMPVLFNNTHNKGFTCRSATNASETEYYLIFFREHLVKKVSGPVVFRLFNLDPLYDVVENVDRIWLDTMHIEEVPNIYRDHALIRYATEKTVFVVLNLTMHAFNSGNAFMSRGYDFGDVIPLDKKLNVFVEKMSIGNAFN